MSATHHPVIGRFAPSPSGALHFGSLLAALASFLDIRQRGGRWLLRIEDIDPYREPPGAADRILHLLDAFGLHWDGPVLYQSQRLEAYSEALRELQVRGLTYPCNCTRRRMRALGGRYDGHCARHPDSVREPAAVRLRVPDAWQQVTEVLRGSDLLDSTPRQIHVLHELDLPAPAYAHIPVASNADGQKLSKQHFARPLEEDHAGTRLHEALAFLGQEPPANLLGATTEQLLQWGIANWDIQKVPRVATIVTDE